MTVKNIIALLIVLVTAPLSLAGKTMPNLPEPAATSYVFIQSATTSTIKIINKDKALYQLTMHGVNPYLHYMSDRPKRIAGLIATNKFFQAWKTQAKNSFTTDAPNVSLEGMELHGIMQKKPVVVTLVLTNPHYDPKKNTVTYDATALGDNSVLSSQKTIKLNHTVLFLDSGWCPSCCCG